MGFINEDNFCTPAQQISERKEKILDGLNPAQRQVAQDYEGFSMVSAGPGAGKTATLVKKIAYMIECGVKSTNILAFSFTKKAANEVHDRVMKAIGDEARGVTVSTYHSFCARQLRRYCAYLGYKDTFSIIDPDDQTAIVNKIHKKLEIQDKAEMSLWWISKFKGEHLTPEQAKLKYGNLASCKNGLQVYAMYRARLKEQNAMDFDDLLFNMTTILEQNQDVRQLIHDRYKYVMADECQDSSVLDTKFLFLLTNPKTKNLCLIGDSDQAIYGFRGADIDKLFGTVNKVKHKNFFLEQNYRSTQTIVNAAQSLIRYNHRPDEKNIFSENPVGEKIIYAEKLTPEAQAQFVASTINKLVKSDALKYGDIAILYRTSFLSRNIEDAFLKLKVPYTMVGGVSFYRRKEVRDVLSFLDFLHNPANMSSLKRVFEAHQSGLGDKSIELITDLMLRNLKSYAIIDLNTAIKCFREILEQVSRKAKLAVFIGKLEAISQWLDENEARPVDVIEKVLTTFDYLNHLKKSEKDETVYQERIKNIIELKNIAGTYMEMGEFLEDLLTNTAEDNKESDDKVTLMTMHASKGLEFRMVFIIGANEGIIPSWRCQGVKDVEEERRLFYVAMTRAEEYLVICSTQTMMQNGRARAVAPSPFIKQIDSQYMDVCA